MFKGERKGDRRKKKRDIAGKEESEGRRKDLGKKEGI